MHLKEVKEALKGLETLRFKLPNGQYVEPHFHVTEVGAVHKKFIDCRGTVRTESKVNFQLWSANDYDHRLHPEKLISIIEISERQLELAEGEIEVEYQGATIERYGLRFDGIDFCLEALATDCLAQDKCGIPVTKKFISLGELTQGNVCTPGSGCC